jgi:hypothetical protein
VSEGAPDDRDQLLITLYRYELGGITSGLAVSGALERSGRIKVLYVKIVRDNEAAIKPAKEHAHISYSIELKETTI